MAEPAKRGEKKERNRRELLQAAASVIAEKGFHRASLMEIADRAGVTTGAIYSNFRSKEALLREVVNEMQPVIRVQQRPGGNASVGQLISDMAVEAGRFVDTPESRRLGLLQLEFLQLQLRDPALMAETRQQAEHANDELIDALTDLGAVPDPGPAPSPEQLTHVLVATIQGLQQHRLIMPDAVPDELFAWAVRTILRAAAKQPAG